MTDKETRTERLRARDQPAGCLYEMSMRFVGDASPNALNDMLAGCGMQERLVVQRAVTLRVTQTVPFIPDDETIGRYAEALASTHADAKTGIAVTNVRFDGYDYLYSVRPLLPDKPGGADE